MAMICYLNIKKSASLFETFICLQDLHGTTLTEGTLKPFGPVAGGQVVKNYYAPLDPNYSPVVPVYVREGLSYPLEN